MKEPAQRAEALGTDLQRQVWTDPRQAFQRLSQRLSMPFARNKSGLAWSQGLMSDGGKVGEKLRNPIPRPHGDDSFRVRIESAKV